MVRVCWVEDVEEQLHEQLRLVVVCVCWVEHVEETEVVVCVPCVLEVLEQEELELALVVVLAC